MTKEEKAIKQLKFMQENMPKEPPIECDYIEEWLDTDKNIRNALDMAIKALDQEPCEEVISRQAVKDLYYKNGYIDFRKVCELPPVNTQTKTGYWKKIATYPLYECSKCKLESMLNTWDYCPNCGCRMVEPQESEGEE